MDFVDAAFGLAIVATGAIILGLFVSRRGA